MGEQSTVKLWEHRLQKPLTELDAKYLDWLDRYCNSAQRGRRCPTAFRVESDPVTGEWLEAYEIPLSEACALVQGQMGCQDWRVASDLWPSLQAENHGSHDGY